MVEPQVVAETMHANDDVAHLLGMRLGSVEVGRAVIHLTVGPEMTNGHDVCHGGILFTLADTAMAHATNATNERALATNAAVDFVNPAPVGSELTATCITVETRGRNRINDVTVTDQDGTTIALFRGRTLTLGGAIADEG